MSGTYRYYPVGSLVARRREPDQQYVKPGTLGIVVAPPDGYSRVEGLWVWWGGDVCRFLLYAEPPGLELGPGPDNRLFTEVCDVIA